ncbi:MAG: rRNA pseudouridine synthase [Candidatus Nanopelagicaceae bacterium]|nr:rRNA pseudouridine synthase [Candidatus Nanopelagicaceae bacterium]
MADSGVASRRACEELILSGRVKVDGKVIRTLGTKIDPINHKVEVDNETITASKTKTYIAFHKPKGVLSTMFDPESRPSLNDFFGAFNERLFHVGRLDKESEGLIILTNDGQWAHEATHPSFGVRKTYLVLCEQEISNKLLEQLEKGVELEDGLAKPISVTRRGAWVELVIHEGRNQIVRRIFESLGNPVERLVRTAIGSIRLGELPAGRWRSLQSEEIINL